MRNRVIALMLGLVLIVAVSGNTNGDWRPRTAEAATSVSDRAEMLSAVRTVCRRLQRCDAVGCHTIVVCRVVAGATGATEVDDDPE